MGLWAPQKSRFAPGSMPGITQNGWLQLLFHAWKSPTWAASPPILGGSGHEIKGVAEHFGGFRAWIPERSDFFKGPKGPKGLPLQLQLQLQLQLWLQLMLRLRLQLQL